MLARTTVLALLCGCGALGLPDDYVLSKDTGEVVLADGQTRLSFRRVHQVQEYDAVIFADDGLPYVSVGDAWLEIAGSLTVANAGYVFEIEKGECETEVRSCGDCSYRALASCSVSVETSSDRSWLSLDAASFDQSFSLADRYAATATGDTNGNLIAVRALGFSIGYFDLTTRTVAAATVPLDIVTSFGVANLDIAAQPIVGHVETVTVGPQRVSVTVLDIGNTNTHCDMVSGCRNVLDLALVVEGSGEQTARVLDYH